MNDIVAIIRGLFSVIFLVALTVVTWQAEWLIVAQKICCSAFFVVAFAWWVDR